MIIHILRHAEAVERSPQIAEEHRYLTARGRTRFRRAAAALKKLELDPDLIVTSPLVRAVQTADILAEGLDYQGELRLDAKLAPGFGPEELDALLAGYPDAKEIVLVGHEPDLGRVATRLLESERPLSLKKGALLSLKRTAGKKSQFLRLLTGSGKAIASRSEALERLEQG